MKFSFDQIVTDYDTHVTQHIPNYKIVIDKTIAICTSYSKSSSILDFGSANGSTLLKLHNQGFFNLHGVEINEKMLSLCNKPFAKFYRELPQIEFDVIIANWVLHFNKDKESILDSFYKHLGRNSVLIISEKLKSNEFVKNQYYKFKTNQGVSQEEIISKEESLKDVMYLDSLDWYLTTLKKIGFRDINIIDGSWGFVTLMASK